MSEDIKKPTLVVVVGTGASVTAGVPDVKAVTNLTEDILPGITSKGWPWPLNGEPPPEGHTLSDAFSVRLRAVLAEHFKNSNFDQGYHFENLLGALEELEDYVRRTTFISRVTDFNPNDKILDEQMAITRARYDLVKAIHQHIGDAVVKPDVRQHDHSRQVRHIFEQLADDFRLVVIDLNYDDVVDDATIDWADGFTNDIGSDACAFDPERWDDNVNDPARHLLIHLHGSVKFGQFPNGSWPTNPDEPVKYPSYTAAKEHVSAMGSHARADGHSYAAPYVISGVGKGAKFAYNLRPYGYYMRALLQLAPRADALLTVGYGWVDPHVNLFLDEFMMLRPSARVAVITRRSGGTDIGNNVLSSEQYLQQLAGRDWRMVNSSACYEQELEPERRSWLSGRLLLFPYGIPLRPADIATLLGHLQGVSAEAAG